jgi:hypothetical protein
METILMIPRELEQFENLVRLARRKRDLEAIENQVSMDFAVPTLRKICINKNTLEQNPVFACGNKQLCC